MKWLTTLMLCIYGASAAIPARDKKQFPITLFSVVSFPNDPCVTNADKTLMGTCLSSDECSSKGGKNDGNCASGFGVCCLFTKDACGSTVTMNGTYIQNPGFSSGFALTAATTCTYNLAGNSDICQIRLDFNNFGIAAPTAANGACATDNFQLAGQSGKNPPQICGNNNGEHMYLETSKSTQASTATFTLNGAVVATRTWRIKVSFIECISEWKAPSGCTKWFTGTSFMGVKSYNFAGQQMLINQFYTTCVRREQGFCGIEWQVSTVAMPAPFLLGAGGATALNTLVGCALSHVIIPATTLDTGAARGTDLFCGGFLNTETAATSSSIVRSNADTFTLRTFSSAAAQGAITGYNLDYFQVPC